MEYKPTNLSTAELIYLANHPYPVIKGGKVYSAGRWERVESKTYDSGLEIYVMKKQGVDEFTFAVRGTDADPGVATDWVGANLAFSGDYHQQYREAIEFVHKFTRYLNDGRRLNSHLLEDVGFLFTGCEKC